MPPRKRPATIPAGGPENIHPELHRLVVPIGSLAPFHKNPRRGDLPLLRESLRANGQYRPVVVNRLAAQPLGGELLQHPDLVLLVVALHGDMTLPEIEAVQRVSLRPGDVVVIRVAASLPADVAQRIHDQAAAVFPDNEIVILGLGATLEIVTPAELT